MYTAYFMHAADATLYSVYFPALTNTEQHLLYLPELNCSAKKSICPAEGLFTSGGIRASA